MNENKITLKTVNEEALDAIRKLKDGKIDVQTAKEIRGMLNVIVDTAKTQIDFLNAIPEEIKYDMGATKLKSIANTVDGNGEDLDNIVGHPKKILNNNEENPYSTIKEINSGQ